MRDKLTISALALLRALGWPADLKNVDSFVDRAVAEGVVETESGDLVTPAGEGIGSLLGRLWDGQTTPSPAPQDTPKSDPHHGYGRADWEGMRPELRYAEADKGPATPSWQKGVPVVNDGMCAHHAGLSLADFKALPLERRLELEAIVKGALITQQKKAGSQ